MNIVVKLLNSFDRFPDRIALSESDRSISYQTLFEQSLKIALFISNKSIKNSCIAIEIDDAIDHIIAIIGVIMSGNYYVSVTAENKLFFLAENKLPFKLSICSSYINAPYPVALVSDIFNQPFTAEGIASLPEIKPKDKICAFFTSGSTGSSKIVIHNHISIFTELLQEIQENEITYVDKLDLVFSLSFSASLSCIFPALLTGAEVCIFNLKKKGLHHLVDFWEQNAITFTTLSVTTFQGVCKLTPTLRHLSSLRFVSVSAEPVKDTTIGLFKDKFPTSAILQIAYATTETRTISDLKIFNNGTIQQYPRSIGMPVGGKQVYILNNEGEIQNSNIIGEIMVESKFIADSYFGNPAENSLSFIRRGDTIQYKTGDLGYLNDDGYLFYYGRKKNEIKINGVKINITNIETEIDKLDEIVQAVTVINSAISDQPKLVCFFQTGQTDISINDIKKSIAPKLPATHLPQFFIKLDQFPFTHSGKIDRKTLEIMRIDDLIVSASSLQPDKQNTKVYEDTLIEVFKKVLEAENVNSNSDFFDLGGDSFTSLLCVAEIESNLKIAVSSLTLLSNPTPAKLGTYLIQTANEQATLVKHVELNGWSSEKQNLYIIDNTFNNNRFKPLIDSYLFLRFNIVIIHYDLLHSYKIDNASQLIIDQLVKIVSSKKTAIVMGYSFDGYIAHQLACIVPQISYCILIDTYNYLEFEKHHHLRTLKNRLEAFLWQIIKNRDHSLPFYRLKKRCNALFRSKTKIDNTSFYKGVNYLVEKFNYKQTINHCIFIKASRSYMCDKNNCFGWRSFVGGNFHPLNLIADHSDIIENHALVIADYINSIITDQP